MLRTQVRSTTEFGGFQPPNTTAGGSFDFCLTA